MEDNHLVWQIFATQKLLEVLVW